MCVRKRSIAHPGGWARRFTNLSRTDTDTVIVRRHLCWFCGSVPPLSPPSIFGAGFQPSRLGGGGEQPHCMLMKLDLLTSHVQRPPVSPRTHTPLQLSPDAMRYTPKRVQNHGEKHIPENFGDSSNARFCMAFVSMIIKGTWLGGRRRGRDRNDVDLKHVSLDRLFKER